MRRTAKAWAKREKSPERWLVSPLVRAVQTAEICIDAFGETGPVEVTPALVPEAPVSTAVDLFEDEDGSIVVVSHEPLMSSVASHLLGMDFGGFKKGMVVALERKSVRDLARLRWILEPAKEDADPKFREES